MADIITLALLVAGLVVLVKSSEFTIDKSVKLANILGLNRALIGFLLLAFATSLPEMAVSVISSLKGESAIAVGTLFGANIADITFVFAATVFAATFRISKTDYEMIVYAIIVSSMIALFSFVLGGAGFAFGVFSVMIFFIFARFVIGSNIRIGKKEKPLSVTFSEIKTTVLILLGIFVVIISANAVTNSAIDIAKSFRLDESVIGATIIALGTTLPEVSISATAARKKEISLAVGNIAGSLVTNLTLIFGIAAMLSPIYYNLSMNIIVIFSIIANIFFLYLARKREFGLMQSILLFALYALFIFLSLFYLTMI